MRSTRDFRLMVSGEARVGGRGGGRCFRGEGEVGSIGKGEEQQLFCVKRSRTLS